MLVSIMNLPFLGSAASKRKTLPSRLFFFFASAIVLSQAMIHHSRRASLAQKKKKKTASENVEHLIPKDILKSPGEKSRATGIIIQE